MNEDIFHLVVRFSDTMFGVGNVIDRHNDVVAKHKAVWFGKMGSTVAVNRVNLIMKQIEQEQPTFLYLVQGNWKKPMFYRAKLLAVTRQIPTTEKKLIPSYYAQLDMIDHMNTWLKVGKISPVDISALNKLCALNSVFPIEETLARSSSGYFLVHEAKSFSG